MKSKVFFRFCSVVSIVLLGVIYTGLAALHACTNGACWPGMGPSVSFSVIAAGLGCTQIMPSITAFLVMWAVWCFDPQEDQENQEEGEDLGGCVVHAILAIILILVPLTTGLSFGGLVSLRACASGKCYPSLATPASLAMFLCGQITNFLVVFTFFIGPMLDLEDSSAIHSVQDFWSIKRRRQVCNLDTAALPA